MELFKKTVGGRMACGAESTVMAHLRTLCKELETEFGLCDKGLQVLFDSRLSHAQSRALPSRDYYEIHIGILDYPDMENVMGREYNHICNTIMHEYVHARNFYSLDDTVSKELMMHPQSLAHYAWRMLDEYCAYDEANARFRENTDELGSDAGAGIRGFEHMAKGLLAGESSERFYDAFYDYSSAVVVWYILGREQLFSYGDGRYKCALRPYMHALETYREKMPLSYEQYHRLGESLINDLLVMIPAEKRNYFKFNAHIFDLG